MIWLQLGKQLAALGHWTSAEASKQFLTKYEVLTRQFYTIRVEDAFVGPFKESHYNPLCNVLSAFFQCSEPGGPGTGNTLKFKCIFFVNCRSY